jgi:hypothetical protein
MTWLRRLWRWLVGSPADVVSPGWVRDHARRSGTVGLDGPSIQWPIDKLRNETPEQRR